MASNRLRFERLEKKHEATVKDFHCGEKPHESWLAEWIKTQAFKLRGRGTITWLGFTDDTDNQLVGFGSLNTDDWPIEEEDGTPSKIRLQTIPAFALQKYFWGQPKGVERSEKYSRQIMRYLLHEAREKLERAEAPMEPLVALVVHAESSEAQRLYLESGFVDLKKRYFDKRTQTFCPVMMHVLN